MGVQRTLKEFLSQTACQCSAKHLNAANKLLHATLHLESVPVRASDLLPRFCEMLGVDFTAAKRALQRTQAAEMIKARHAATLAAAAIVMGCGVEVGDAARATHTSPSTIAKVVAEWQAKARDVRDAGLCSGAGPVEGGESEEFEAPVEDHEVVVIAGGASEVEEAIVIEDEDEDVGEAAEVVWISEDEE
eukprot:2582702-Rhodomonas_salina.2